ncbi:Beta-hexosaminidase [bacterium HR11]|nr:Beta-hexosaminidase [bacterium HR11]
MSIDVRTYLGQLFWVGLEGLELAPYEREFLRDVRPGGIILFRRNVGHPEQLGRLIEDVYRTVGSPPPWVAVDEEGGRVQRLQGILPTLPSAHWLSQVPGFPHERYHELVAECLFHLGIRVNLYPVLDLCQSDSWMHGFERCIAADPRVVVRQARLIARAYRRRGVALCMKHFPGLGRAVQDTHVGRAVVPVDEATLWATDLRPFRAMRRWIPMTMVAHAEYPAWDPGVPASLSARVYEVLRRRLRYSGLALTDDLQMDAVARRWSPVEAASLALRAGADGLLFAHGLTSADLALAEVRAHVAYRAEPALAARIRRILRWKARYLREPPRVAWPEFDIARRRLTGLLDAFGWSSAESA